MGRVQLVEGGLLAWSVGARRLALHTVVWVSREKPGAVLVPAVLLWLLVGCSGQKVPVGTSVVRILSTPAPSPTPTLAQEGGAAVYLPVIIEGRHVKPTATATASVPTAERSDSLVVTSALSVQRASSQGSVLEVEGEVRNDGARAVRSARITVEAWAGDRFCGRGLLTLLGKAEAVLNPGDGWPFAGTVHLKCEAEEVAFQTLAVETEEAPVRLAVEQVAVQVSPEGDWMLTGSLRNLSGVVVSYPRAVLTLRAPDGTYLASGLAYASVAVLRPGDAAPVEVTVARERTDGWASFSVTGTGERE